MTDFRAETRAWLEHNCPSAMRRPLESDADICWGGRGWEFHSDDQRNWLERMVSKGWTAPTWPAALGGGGLSAEQAQILSEEMARIDARKALDNFGLWMIGPAILKYGSERLKKQHIPAIVRGDIRWCQGYSEPNAGSDLAGLQTKAEDHGDHFVVNGQKVWTSHADKCDWMFCLVRTDPDAKKQCGISLVLFDMQTPGVKALPIKLISGSSPFCETFLDNVKVDKDQVVGEINDGWTVAKYLLTHERETIGAFGLKGPGGDPLGFTVRRVCGVTNGKIRNGGIRSDVARWDIDAKAFELTMQRVNEANSMQGVGNASAMLKLVGTELNKRRHEILMEAHGTDALNWGDGSPNGRAVARDWLRSKGNSIEGGTSEIQLNIIAKHILRLG
ncbi:MAG: acyl-CoA dehydrogenase family protein [Pseudomonadota bacterium]